MARLARIVVPDIPHHVIQRGNRKQTVFFSDQDKQAYLNILKEQTQELGLQFWAWCLMDNHVHFVVVPKDEPSLSRSFAEAHRRYSRMINFRNDWRGYLWQGRFLSYPLSESHLYAAVRYVELNPVKAGMVRQPEEYPWSSAYSRILKLKDPLLTRSFLDDEINNWKEFLNVEEGTDKWSFEQHAKTGRPLGDLGFLKMLEKLTGRELIKRKPGPKARALN